MRKEEVTDMTENRGKMIMQFMWSYQHTFRTSVITGLRMALDEVGFSGDVDVLLVGLQAAGTHAFPICIEPEEGPYDPAMLSSVERRGRELYGQHPDRDMWYSDSRFRIEIPARLQREMRAKAIEELLASSRPGADRTFFASMPVRVDDYDVHVVASIDRAALAAVPQLHTTLRDRMRIYPSLVHAIIDDALRRAVRALYMPDPGRDLVVLQALSPEIAQSAATAFVRSVFTCADYLFGERSSVTVNAISALPYEGRPGSGRLIIAKADHPAVDVLMKFDAKVDINNTQAVRKILEASGSEGDLLSTGDKILGLGRLTADYDAASETAFIISVIARGIWELSHADQVLMTVRDGTPHLPRPPLDAAYFTDVVERLLPGADQPRLLTLAEAAGQHQHGAMLIISSDAAAEARRLAPQAWTVEPVRLAPELLRQLTAMDGGVLIDSQGHCHAIGVILDGRACGAEDPARGSRFNNAVRYLESEAPQAVVVVYSADGGIDILPRIRSRVKRSVVQQVVEQYLSLATTPGKYQFGRAEAWDRVSQLRFYLSEDQCRLVNEARAALDRWDEENGHMRIIEQPFSPNPEMNDTYWLPEDT
jgi:hypothetical protein